MNLSQAYALKGPGRRIALRGRVGLVADGEPLGEAHLFTFGEWLGHPSGPFTFDEGVCAALVRNFESQHNPVPFTYEHDSTPGQPRPAAGWVQSLEQRADGLWAKVEWTRKAREMIRDGEYVFCSVVIDFESIDRKTAEDIGPELLEVGLTNTPFVDGQEPLKASRAASDAQRKLSMDPKQIEESMKAIRAALGLDDKATADQVKGAIDAMAELAAAIKGEVEKEVEEMTQDNTPGAAGDMPAPRPEEDKEMAKDVACAMPPPPPSAVVPPVPAPGGATGMASDVVDEAAAGVMLVTKLTEATGLDEAGLLAAIEAQMDQIVSIIGAAPASGMPSDSEAVSASNDKVAQLSAEVFSLREQLVTAEVDNAIKLGRLPSGQRDAVIKLGKVDIKAAKELIDGAARSAAVPPLGRLVGNAPAHNPTDTPQNDDERRVMLSLPKNASKKTRETFLSNYRAEFRRRNNA